MEIAKKRYEEKLKKHNTEINSIEDFYMTTGYILKFAVKPPETGPPFKL